MMSNRFRYSRHKLFSPNDSEQNRLEHNISRLEKTK
jgi:hypothetical protein